MQKHPKLLLKIYFKYNIQTNFFFSVGPLNIKLLAEHQSLSAGTQYELQCESTGSRPPAMITWWKNGQRLEKSKEMVKLFYSMSHMIKIGKLWNCQYLYY